ncbi:hypothetical protein HYFRA_00001339 [Hymenoscyphus fraxineus]|uniref:Uncharacterized protein n=1 Tax=Hymenoscyphus fraxineus TaxID=746836 RepID=A0A9N9L3S7_9HELO|nr:hypothetical protein HYFRA_00001339 [Hymenoscyphus fraxineus]
MSRGLLIQIASIAILISCTFLVGIHYGRFTSRQPSMWDALSHRPNSPTLTLNAKLFKPIANEESFKSAKAAANDTNWKELLSAGEGFLQVQNENGRKVKMGVSMFHQLHCLVMLRDLLLNPTMAHASPTGDWPDDNLHWLHCFDYLAQGVLCAADDTLEKPGFTKNTKGEVAVGIDGMNQIHQCRDSSKLWDVVLDSQQKSVKSEMLGKNTVFPFPGSEDL